MIIVSTSSVPDLGVYIDADLPMRTHVSKTSSGCFATLRQIRSVRCRLQRYRRWLCRLCCQNLTKAMHHWPAFQLIFFVVCSRFSTTARTITGLPRSAHISMTLVALHWLRAAEHVNFKLATLMYRCLRGTAPCYFSANFIRVAGTPACRRSRSSTTNCLIVCPTRIVTVGDRSFTVAVANLWKSLPNVIITSLDSQVTFRR